ncbi:phosphopantetheine-binding protein [Streptomyces diastatochromogenes]|nr:phosphopantetheine-binding protein [Streptomyces diastatochromogenes]
MIAGRAGNDLKVSGRRVSYHRFVAEAEELADVAQCVVVDRQGPHAFVAVRDLAPEDEGTLRERVRAVAGRLELPAPDVHVRRELPLLRSGKVDRMALAASVSAEEASGPGAPSQEATTTDVLLELLDAQGESTASTAFVEAGLGSLDMIAFVARVNRHFGLALSAQDCFGHRDVASLAAAIERLGRTETPASAVPEDAADTVSGEPGTHPLSTRQLAYLATCMADGNANWCNLSREVRVEGR